MAVGGKSLISMCDFCVAVMVLPLGSLTLCGCVQVMG